MRSIVRAALLGSVVFLSSGAVARAGEECPRHEKAAAKAAAHKVGDKVYVCTCKDGCCNTISAKPGKCGCGMDLVEGTVTKVEAGEVTVKTAAGEKVIKAQKT